MAQGKGRVPKADRNRDKEVQADIKKLYTLNQNVNAVQQVSSAPRGSANQSPNQPQSGFLKVQGDTMIGPIAFFPNATTIVASAIDIGIGTDPKKYTSFISVLGITDPDDLDTITGAEFSGQVLWIQANTTTQILLTNAGNIITTDGADFAINKGNVAMLIFDPTVGGGKWRVIASSAAAGAAGANITLSNLSATTLINSSLVSDTDVTDDLGTGSIAWNDAHIRSLRLDEGGTGVGGAGQIYRDAGGVVINFPSGLNVTFQENAVDKATISGSRISAGEFFVNDTTADPAANGEFQRNVNDVKVFSGGSVRNLSDIGATAGANVTLSNLTAENVRANTHIDPASDSVHNLGDAFDWLKVNADAYRLKNDFGVTGSIFTLGRDTISAVETMILNVPLGRNWRVSEAGEGNPQLSLDMTTGIMQLEDKLDEFRIVGSVGTLSIAGPVGAGDVQFSVLGVGAGDFAFLNPVSFGLNPAISIVITDEGDADFNGKNITDIGDITPAANKDLGSSGGADAWDRVFLEALVFPQTVGGVSANYQIYRNASTQMIFNVPTNAAFVWETQGSASMILTKTGATSALTGLDDVTTRQLTLNVENSVPAINGVMASDGTDVRVFSGDALRNLSDIGSSDKIFEGDSSVEVVDSGTGTINFKLDGSIIIQMTDAGGLIMTKPINMGTVNKIVLVADPTADQDVANKRYVDGLVGGVFSDDAFTLEDDLDDTKKAKFGVQGIQTGTTRTFFLPDHTGIVITDAGTQTLTGNKTFSGSTFTVNSTNINLGNALGDNINVLAQLLMAVNTRLRIPVGASLFN